MPSPAFLFLSRDDGTDGEACVSNKFVNDGSFLQQFLKLQKEKSSAGRSASEQQEALPSPGGTSFV